MKRMNNSNAKILAIGLLLLTSMFGFAQVKIYKTIGEYKSDKPSFTGDRMVFQGNIALFVGKVKQKIDPQTIWGYSEGNRDYRMIDKEPHFIATKGVYYVYSGSADSITLIGDSAIYHKSGNAYTYVGKGLEGTPQKTHSYKDFLKMIEPAEAAEINKIFEKEKKDPKAHPVNAFGRIVYKNTLTSFTEDMADYYNSTRPGYVGKRFKAFIYIY